MHKAHTRRHRQLGSPGRTLVGEASTWRQDEANARHQRRDEELRVYTARLLEVLEKLAEEVIGAATDVCIPDLVAVLEAFGDGGHVHLGRKILDQSVVR